MMDYEIRQELKRLGFPIHDFDGVPKKHHTCHCGADIAQHCIPSLEELMEELGTEFVLEKKTLNGIFGYTAGILIDLEGNIDFPQIAGNAKDALALLWINLRKV